MQKISCQCPFKRTWADSDHILPFYYFLIFRADDMRKDRDGEDVFIVVYGDGGPGRKSNIQWGVETLGGGLR